MTRMPRIQIENTLYYIVSRGDHDQDLFREGSDYNMYLELLKKNKEQYGFKLFGYCLAANQINMLIELIGDTTISQIMHGLNSTYTKYFSAKYHRPGHLFQERYRMVLVEKEPNLLPMTAYIHLRPKALKLAEEAGRYPYASYQLYLSEGPGRSEAERVDIRREIKEVCGHLNGTTYEKFVNAISADEIETIDSELSKKAIIGSQEFIDKVKSKVESEKGKAEYASRLDPAASRRMTVAGIIIVVALSVLALSLYGRNAKIRENLKGEMVKKEAELKNEFAKAKVTIREDLDEKYRADMVSFLAMQKRLELEKQKTAELSAKIKMQAAK